MEGGPEDHRRDRQTPQEVCEARRPQRHHHEHRVEHEALIDEAPAQAVLAKPPHVGQHEEECQDEERERAEDGLTDPVASGSARFDAMVIAPCSMASLGRIAAGTSDSALLRAADVFLKERRQLILVPRETPWSLIHARNVVTLLEAGALVLPAIPSFYSRPQSVNAAVDTGVCRIIDQTGLPAPRPHRRQAP